MKKNVLYVEDNPINMTLVRRVLQSRGHFLFEAVNGVDGLSIAKTQDVDVILLDINLPDIDGYEVARRIRSSENAKLSTIPIIAVTANALKGDAEKAIEAGCDLYISKPINIKELVEKVEKFALAMDAL